MKRIEFPEDDMRGAVGSAIRLQRIRQNLKQGDLAARIGMSAAQLCNIEKDKNSPSLKTLERITEALDISLTDLMKTNIEEKPESFSPVELKIKEKANKASAKHVSLQMEDHKNRESEEKSDEDSIARLTLKPSIAVKKVLSSLQNVLELHLQEYIDLEEKCKVSKSSSLPFTLPFIKDERGAELLAHTVRMICGCSSTPIRDVFSFLEMQGIHVMSINLPDPLESLSFYDEENQNLAIFVKRQLTPERQQFRLCYELGNTYLYFENGHQTVEDSSANRRFAKHFAAAFLMPEETIRLSVHQLNLSINDWTLPIVLHMKHCFGVSAEAFIYRLEELGLLSATERRNFKHDLDKYYEKHENNEPTPNLRNHTANGRLEALKLCLKK